MDESERIFMTELIRERLSVYHRSVNLYVHLAKIRLLLLRVDESVRIFMSGIVRQSNVLSVGI